MQYNVKKELADKTMVKLQWHGDATRVLVHGKGEKTEVETGGVLEVDKKQAAELLGYSSLWTFEGDVPTPQPYRENLKRLAEKKPVVAPGAESDVTLSASSVAKMSKKELQKELKKLGATFNDQATNEELRDLLTEALAEKKPVVEAAEEVTEQETV